MMTWQRSTRSISVRYSKRCLTKQYPLRKPKYLRTARIATLRGHDVTIYEKSKELGGVFNAAAAPKFKEKDKNVPQLSDEEKAEMLKKGNPK